MRTRSLSSLAVVGTLVLAGANARANGRFPAASLIAFHPLDSSSLVVSTTFGLLVSQDAGQTFTWTCEFALGAVGEVDFAPVLTAQGAVVVGTFSGIVRSTDGCTYETVPGVGLDLVRDVTLSRGAPNTVFAFRGVGVGSDLFASEVVRSDDDGESWVRLEPLPDTILPLTIDVAPSDPARLYLTARLPSDSNFVSALLRSDDAGESFETMEVPETSDQRLAFIAGVHPTDAERLYVRVLDPAGTVIWHTLDGGLSFDRVTTGAGQLLGFAISPDGRRIAWGGPNDGVWVADADGGNAERRSDIGPSCLGWSDAGLYACADASLAGFSLGRSSDEGGSFEPLLSFAGLCGMTACDASSDLARECAFDWQSVGPQVGATCEPVLTAEGSGNDAGTPGRGESSNEPRRNRSSDCSVGSLPAGQLPAVAWTLPLGLVWLRRRPRGCQLLVNLFRSTGLF